MIRFDKTVYKCDLCPCQVVVDALPKDWIDIEMRVGDDYVHLCATCVFKIAAKLKNNREGLNK